MKLAALVSGGKDGLYAAYLARLGGHRIACTVTVAPRSDRSHMLHEPGTRVAALQSESMGIAHLRAESGSGTAAESSKISQLLRRAAEEHGAQAAVHGGIASRFQRDAFERAAEAAGMGAIAPLRGADQKDHMRNLLRDRFKFAIVSVGSEGLGPEWLGRTVTEDDAVVLAGLAERHSFNPAFEGGEAETLVLDCPLFSRPVELSGRAVWDRCRGRFEISGARLCPRA